MLNPILDQRRVRTIMLRISSIISLRTRLLIYEACVVVLAYRPRRSPAPLCVLIIAGLLLFKLA